MQAHNTVQIMCHYFNLSIEIALCLRNGRVDQFRNQNVLTVVKDRELRLAVLENILIELRWDDRVSAFLERLLKEEGVIYGVTTGYGDSCTVAIPPNLVDELPLHLTRFHGCGLGEYRRRHGRDANRRVHRCNV